ncbi:MAG: response regulator [Elusimicrobiota bacterium]
MNNKGQLNILIADDEAHVRVIIKAYFTPYNVNIVEARNGKEVIEILDEDNIDLIVLDYTMPIMTGKDVLEEILKREGLKRVPVIVYTAGGFDEQIERWLKTSSAAFIEKYSLGDDLIPTVKEILGSNLKKKN